MDTCKANLNPVLKSGLTGPESYRQVLKSKIRYDYREALKTNTMVSEHD